MLPAAPDYLSGSLVSVLPAVARSLGSSRYAAVPGLGLGPADRAVVVLVDGLGYEQLVRRSGHAPFLRANLDSTLRLDSGFPSTTATSMGSFGTGTPPGAHGLVGYEVLDPDRDLVFNELSWENGPDPFRWQPTSTVFQEVLLDGVEVTRIGPGFFDGSGLTNAALRGGRFRAASSMADRVSAAVDAVKASPRALVYLYWGEMDKVGHVHGCQSWEWGDELELIDRAMGRLVAGVPSDTAVIITADHGMVDAPHALRIDLAHDGELAAGVRHVGGEFRAPQLYCEEGAVPDVLATWRGSGTCWPASATWRESPAPPSCTCRRERHRSRSSSGGRTGWPTGPGWGPVTRWSTPGGSVRCAPTFGTVSVTSSRSCSTTARSWTRPGCDPSWYACAASTGRSPTRSAAYRSSRFRPGPASHPHEVRRSDTSGHPS